MQRNILKIALACGMALFLAAPPINTLTAAENSTQSTVDTDTQNGGASELREIYYVNAQSGLKVRSAPSKDSEVITLLPYGAEVTVIGTSDNSWFEIEYSNESAYVSASYITKSSEDTTGTDTDGSTTETDESIPSTVSALDNVETTLGATPVILALIAAIIIMILLAIFTAYSFLKKDKNNCNEAYDEDYNEEDYDEDRDDYANGYDEDTYSNDSEESIDEAYYDEEYYDDEE